jgi:hypothetical protein
MEEQKKIENQSLGKQRVIYKDGKWVKSQGKEEIVKMVIGLTENQRAALFKKCTHQSVLLDVTCEKVWEKCSSDAGLLLMVLQEQNKTVVSSADRSLKYSCASRDYRYGCTTTLSDGIDAMFTWGVRNDEDGRPDTTNSLATLVASFGRPTADGAVSTKVSKAPGVKTYFPRPNGIGSYIDYAEKNCESACSTYEMLVESIADMVKPGQVGREQVIDDVVAAQPLHLIKGRNKGVRKAKSGDRVALIKATPTRVDKISRPFSDIVEGIAVMSTSLGTESYGFGRISSYHYDGIPMFSSAVRKRHEWITDFIPQQASVYLLNNRDPTLALSLYRTVKDIYPDNKIAVVYDANQTDLEKRRTVFKYDDTGVVTGILKEGVVGISALSWTTYFAKCDAYYISFKAYVKGKGHKSELVSTSIDARQPAHLVASAWNKYMYYGFIGAMNEDDKVHSSCRGRHGDVIFSNIGHFDRYEAALVTFNCVKHAILYPWLHSCFRHKVGGKFFYRGVREFKKKYNFCAAISEKKLVVDFGDSEVTSYEAIEEFAQNVLEESQPIATIIPVVVQEEEEADEDADMFAAIDGEGDATVDNGTPS